jgi:hypothetical protein
MATLNVPRDSGGSGICDSQNGLQHSEPHGQTFSPPAPREFTVHCKFIRPRTIPVVVADQIAASIRYEYASFFGRGLS